MALWDEVKKNMVEWYTLASDKTTEEARIVPRRWDKFGISRDIERQFSELGSLIYIGLKDGNEGILAEESVLALVGKIESLESELTTKSDEIENIRAEYVRAAASAGAAAAQDPVAADADSVGETVITDPVLEMGSEDSAILVEPAESQDDETHGDDEVAPEMVEGDEEEPETKE